MQEARSSCNDRLMDGPGDSPYRDRFGQLFFKLFFDRRRMVFLAVALSLFLGTQLLAYVALRNWISAWSR